jgi:hypothetical protein
LVDSSVEVLVPRIRVLKPIGCLPSIDAAPKQSLMDLSLQELPPEPSAIHYPTPALFKRDGKSVLWTWTEREPSRFVSHDANANAWLVEKTFSNLRLVLEKDAAPVTEYLKSENTLVVGPTGFSSLKPADLELLGLSEGDYEVGVEAYLCGIVVVLQKVFPGIHLVIADGASDSGVDRATISAANRLEQRGVGRIGHTCFKYLQYVKDEEGLVIVSDTPEDYAQVFTSHVDVLLGLGGRDHALELDIAAVSCSPTKLLVIPQLIKSISRDGTAPPVRCGDKLVDATGLFGQHLRIVSPREGTDPLQSIICGTAEEAIDICRRLVPAAQKFAIARSVD